MRFEIGARSIIATIAIAAKREDRNQCKHGFELRWRRADPRLSAP